MVYSLFLGYVDDVLLLPGLIWLAIKLSPPDVLQECRGQADAWMQSQGKETAQPGRGGDDRVALGGDKYCGVVLACAVLSITR